MMSEMRQAEARKNTNPGVSVRPPRFKYRWIDDKTLIMHYEYHRSLIDLAIALIEAVGEYYEVPFYYTIISSVFTKKWVLSSPV